MLSIRNWFMRLIGKEVEAFGYNIPANFKRACPAMQAGFIGKCQTAHTGSR
ncbi:hypothetical protein [Enterobacter phage N5822]|nr:hypothetical protein [Enterobacter phage N5822]